MLREPEGPPFQATCQMPQPGPINISEGNLVCDATDGTYKTKRLGDQSPCSQEAPDDEAS